MLPFQAGRGLLQIGFSWACNLLILTLLWHFHRGSPNSTCVSQIESGWRIASFSEIEAAGRVLTFSQRFVKRNFAVEVEWNAHCFPLRSCCRWCV